MLELNRIHCGDNCDLLGKMPRESVDLVVTSPPYDDLRTYGGHSWDFFGVAWHLKRVLNNVLRESLSKMHDTYFKTDEDEELCKRALASTPEQSLFEYRNKVIEE